MPLPLTVSCFSKSRLVLPIWYRLTRVVVDKGLFVCVRRRSRCQYLGVDDDKLAVDLRVLSDHCRRVGSTTGHHCVHSHATRGHTTAAGGVVMTRDFRECPAATVQHQLVLHASAATVAITNYIGSVAQCHWVYQRSCSVLLQTIWQLAADRAGRNGAESRTNKQTLESVSNADNADDISLQRTSSKVNKRNTTDDKKYFTVVLTCDSLTSDRNGKLSDDIIHSTSLSSL